MFKLSKTSLMILGVGVMIVVSVALYLAYSQYVSQRDALYVTIETAQKKIAQVSTEKRSLEPQLTQLQQKTAELKASYDKAKGEFPNVTIQSIENDEELSGLAEDSSVTFTRLTATDSTALQEGNLTYFVTDFSIEVKGDRTNVLDFIHRVAMSSYFATATINTVNLTTGGDAPTPGAPEVPAPVNYSLFLSLTIYRYEGN